MQPNTARSEQMTRVLVTGGSSGIGRACAHGFAAAGHDVVITGRCRRQLITTSEELGGIPYLVFNAADPLQVNSALGARSGKFDIVVNNVGGNRFQDKPPESLPELSDQWLTNLKLNLLSSVLVTAAVESRIPDNGRIVTMGSIAGRRGNGSYGAAKAALVAWNIDTARRLGSRGITANVIAPGLVQGTDFFDEPLTRAHRSQLESETFLHRLADCDDVVGVVIFLASPAARHITGQVLHVNGGAWLGN